MKKGNHGEESGFDVPRTMRLASFGAALDAPILKSWYDLLDKYIPRADARAVAVKLVLDQVLFACLVSPVQRPVCLFALPSASDWYLCRCFALL